MMHNVYIPVIELQKISQLYFSVSPLVAHSCWNIHHAYYNM